MSLSQGKCNDAAPASGERDTLYHQGRSVSLPQELGILRAAMTAVGPSSSMRALPDALAGEREGAPAAKQPCSGRTVRAFSMPIARRPDRMSNLGRGSLRDSCAATEATTQPPALDIRETAMGTPGWHAEA